MRRLAQAALLALVGLCGVQRADAQEWAGALALGGAGIVWPEDAGGGDLLDGGLAPRAPAGFRALYTSWYALPEWSTQAATVWVGRAATRVALGAAVTGGRALGWRSAAAGLGVVEPWAGAGAAFRVRDEPARIRPTGSPMSGLDLSVSGGGWARVARAVRVSLSSGRLWAGAHSELPAQPAQACLFIGGADLGAALAWRGDVDGARETALALRLAGGPLRLAAGARTGPWRSALGVEADWRGFTVGSAVELHPVLGTTTRLTFGWGMR